MFTNLKPYPDYVKSSVSWLGARPLHWLLAPGMAVLLPVKAKNSNLTESTVLSLSYGRIVVKPSDRMHGLVPASFDTYQVLDSGNIVVRPTDLQNDQTSLRVGIVRDHGIITSAYLGFTVVGDVAPEFAYMYLAALDALKVFYGMGSGLRQNLELGDFKRLPFLLPPADEQAAIVKYLGHANARIDRAITAKRKLIALLEEQKQAVINQAVTSGLDSTVPLKDSGVPHLGEVPLLWSVEPFLRCVVERADYRGATPEKVDTGIFLVTAKNVRKGWIDYEASQEFVRESDYSKIMRRGLVRLGDLLLTMEAPLGNVAAVDREDIALAQRLVRFRTDHRRLRPAFAVMAMNSSYFQAQFAVRATGSTAQGMKASKLPQLVLAIPPVDEQDRIVSHVASHSSGIDGGCQRTMREISLLREFRTRLTADVVTGQLDIRDTAARLPELDLADLVSDAESGEDELDADHAKILEEVTDE